MSQLVATRFCISVDYLLNCEEEDEMIQDAAAAEENSIEKEMQHAD